MTNKRVVYSRPDGGVSVLIPAPRVMQFLMDAGFTEERALAIIIEKDVPEGAADVEVVEAEAIPPDRGFRDAWERDTSSSASPVRVNMEKARTLHMDRIRAVRDQKLAALDIFYQRADEARDEARKDEIAAQKQALRDIPMTFDLDKAKTPEALKALWPDELR